MKKFIDKCVDSVWFPVIMLLTAIFAKAVIPAAIDGGVRWAQIYLVLSGPILLSAMVYHFVFYKG